MTRFRDRDTRKFADGLRVARFQAFEKTGRRRLIVVLDARDLKDFSLVPGYRFEALHGDRAGQYSIRINDQWRICFSWDEGSSWAVGIEIVDYH